MLSITKTSMFHRWINHFNVVSVSNDVESLQILLASNDAQFIREQVQHEIEILQDTVKGLSTEKFIEVCKQVDELTQLLSTLDIDNYANALNISVQFIDVDLEDASALDLVGVPKKKPTISKKDALKMLCGDDYDHYRWMCLVNGVHP